MARKGEEDLRGPHDQRGPWRGQDFNAQFPVSFGYFGSCALRDGPGMGSRGA